MALLQKINSTNVFEALGLGISDKLKSLLSELDWAQMPIDPLKVCREFCNVGFEGRIMAIGEELDLAFWKGIASQWNIWPDSPDCQIRLDRKMVLHLLSSSLGQQVGDNNFSCNSMIELEREIVENLTQELIDHFTTHLQAETVNDRHANWMGKMVHIVWAVNADNEIAKIAFSLPIERVPTHFGIVESHPVREEDSCSEVTIRCNLLVGTSTMTLAELVKLETNDFLLLENSDRNCFNLVGHDGLTYALPVVIGARKNDSKWHKINLSDNKIQEVRNMSQVLNSDVLSDFPVEVKVEFREVKMTLKDLFALQSGWVLPIDQVTDNELFLTSQGKTIAKGELVVAGNKFGILIKEVLLSANQQ